MKVLVYGSKGWIGSQFIQYTSHETIEAQSRPENYTECCDEISYQNPDVVISFIGRTHGMGYPTIDYLELPGKLVENMRDNFIAPLHLAEICKDLGIQYIYLGTGCIYTYTEGKKVFSEKDTPNFFGSQYSIVKGSTDTELRRYSNVLQLRIRMPVSKNAHPRNLIDKLISYKKICSLPNSMTVLDDMWPIIDKMISVGETGVYNMANPGTTDHNWILQKFKEYLCPSHSYELVSYEEQLKYIHVGRSNNELDVTKLALFCRDHNVAFPPPIEKSIEECLQRRV